LAAPPQVPQRLVALEADRLREIDLGDQDEVGAVEGVW
jgi:hypothetical protein